MRLVDLPRDILLNTFYLLRVRDILAVERTCTVLRAIVTIRHLWLVQLQLLDQACAPDLPPYADVEQLSYFELRSTVTRAIRWHEICKRGMIASPETRRDSIQLMAQHDLSSLARWPGIDRGGGIQLAPGGKHLVIIKNGFKVFSVQTGRCICQWGSSLPLVNSMRTQKFALEARSEHSLLILHACSSFGTGAVMFELFQLDYYPEEEVHVRKIAASEIPRERNTLSAITSTVLGGEFGIMSISSNQVRSLLIWNWHSNRLTEVVVGRALWHIEMQIMRRHLFYILNDHRLSHQFSIGTCPLQQFNDLRPMVINFDDIKKSSATLQPLIDGCRMSDVVNLALYDSARFGFSRVIEASVMAHVDIEASGKPYMTAVRFVFDLQDTAEPNPLSFRLVHHSTPRCPSDGNAFMELPPPRVGATHRTGKAVIDFTDNIPPLRVRDAPQDVHPSSNCYLVGMDENGEIFHAPLSRRLREDYLRLFFDDYSGALVRLVVRDHTPHIDVHYITQMSSERYD